MRLLTTSLALTATLIAGCSSSSSTPEATDNDQDTTGQDTTDQDTTGGDTTDSDTTGGSTTDSDTTTGQDTTGSTGTTFTGNVLQVGMIDIEESVDDAEVETFANFFQLSAPFDGAELTTLLQSARQESCLVSVQEAFDPTDLDDLDFSDFELPDIDFNAISAGDVITLSSLTGSYGEITLQTFQGFSFYGSDSELVYPAPNPLFIDIPGAAFPAFSNIEVAAAPKLTNASTDSVSASTTLTWDSATVGDADVSFGATSGTLSDSTSVDIDCNLTDDGSFTIPASAVNELNTLLGSGWTLDIYDLERTVTVVRQSGSAVLVVTRETD